MADEDVPEFVVLWYSRAGLAVGHLQLEISGPRVVGAALERESSRRDEAASQKHLGGRRIALNTI